MSDELRTGTKPDHIIKIGAVRAALWSKTVQRDGRDLREWTIQLDRTIKVGDTFRSSSRFTTAQLHSIITAAQMSFEHIVTAGREVRKV
jgi:hypothetical protein